MNNRVKIKEKRLSHNGFNSLCKVLFKLKLALDKLRLTFIYLVLFYLSG